MAKAFVYRNLHKKCWSIKHKGRVIAHAPRVFIWDSEFWVNPSGNEKVRKEKRKNVHAYVVAELDDVWVSEDTKILKETELYRASCVKKLGEINTLRVTYQPYKMKTFQEVTTNKPVFDSTHTYLTARGSVFVPDLTPPPKKAKRVEEKKMELVAGGR